MKQAFFAIGLGFLVCAVASGAESQPAWQLDLRAGKPAAVFDVGEEAQVTALLRNGTGRDAEAVIEFAVSDQEGHNLASGSAPAVVPANETRAAPLRLGRPPQLPQEEYLAVHVRLVTGGKLRAECRKGFGFLPKREVTAPAESSPFGLLSDGQWPLLQRLGVRYNRPNWTWAERPMDWAMRYKIAYCPLVNEANAFVRGELTERQYETFVRESVRRYKGYVRYWQLGNEFDIFHRDGPKAYVESQRIGYAAAKAEDPTCTVVGGSITELQVRREGFRESLDLGLAKYCDLYDFHFYADLNTTQELLDYIHVTCKQHRAEKPIWVTETSQVGMFDPDDRNQAEYIFKRYAHLLANGVSVVFWHVLSWPYPYSADKVQATAIVDHEGFARPSLFAYAALTRDLGGCKFTRSWDLGKGVYAIEFARGARSLFVLWSEAGDRSIQVQHTPGEISRTLPSGKRAGQPSPEGLLRVRLTRSPVIYDVPGPGTISVVPNGVAP